MLLEIYRNSFSTEIHQNYFRHFNEIVLRNSQEFLSGVHQNFSQKFIRILLRNSSKLFSEIHQNSFKKFTRYLLRISPVFLSCIFFKGIHRNPSPKFLSGIYLNSSRKSSRIPLRNPLKYAHQNPFHEFTGNPPRNSPEFLQGIHRNSLKLTKIFLMNSLGFLSKIAL